MLNVCQSSGWFFSRMARHSFRTVSASVHFFCWSRFRPSGRQFAGVGGGVGPGPLLDHRQPLPPPGLGLVELLRLFVSSSRVDDDPAGVLVLEPALLDARGGLLEQGDGLGQLAGGLVRPGQVVQVLRVSGWSAPSFLHCSVADLLEQGDGLGQLAGGLVRPARLLSVVRVSGWSAPSFFTWASRTCSYRAMASGSLPAAWYATARLLQGGEGVGVVGPQLLHPRVADLLEQGDGLGQPAGGLVRHGQVVAAW